MVSIWVGGYTETTSTFVSRFSGNLTGSALDALEFISPNNYLVVKFDTDYSDEMKGFMATFSESKF